MKSWLNRHTAPMVVRLLDICFRRGVLDAMDFGDDYTAKEWCEDKIQNEGYGLLSESEVEYDWRRWQFTIMRWCRLNRMATLSSAYLDRIRKKTNFLFVVIPMTMRFYLMGIQEWLEYPNPNKFVFFENQPKTHWKPVDAHLKNMTTDDFISYVQEFVYERSSHPEEVKEKGASDASFDDFREALWRTTRKYPVIYDTSRRRASEEEDV